MNRLRMTLLMVIAIWSAVLAADKKYVGGDISLLPTYEQNGAIYLDSNGVEIADMLGFLKAQNLNAMRVRLFVNPVNARDAEKGEGVRQNLEYIIPLCRQIKEMGFALMLDFHYSDTWADPAKQWIPKDWVGQTDEELEATIYDYTTDVLRALVDAGATPDFIQTGNEISYGMLWGDVGDETHKAVPNQPENWTYFTNMLKSAGRACREVIPEAKIVLHVERVDSPAELTGFFDRIAEHGVDYDILGLSYYPYFHGTISGLETAINALETQLPDKPIMIVETGYYHSYQPEDIKYDLSDTYPITPAGQAQFTKALIDMLNRHQSVTGLFWWFMEANEFGLDWDTDRVTDHWYNAGLWDNSTGMVSPALFVLKDFLDGTDLGITTIGSERNERQSLWHTIDGRQLTTRPTRPGLYLHNTEKVIVR